jgi:hypothetical protein
MENKTILVIEDNEKNMKLKRSFILLLFFFLIYNLSVHYHHCNNNNVQYDCFTSHAVYGNLDFLIYDSYEFLPNVHSDCAVSKDEDLITPIFFKRKFSNRSPPSV